MKTFSVMFCVLLVGLGSTPEVLGADSCYPAIEQYSPPTFTSTSVQDELRLIDVNSALEHVLSWRADAISENASTSQFDAAISKLTDARGNLLCKGSTPEAAPNCRAAAAQQLQPLLEDPRAKGVEAYKSKRSAKQKCLAQYRDKAFKAAKGNLPKAIEVSFVDGEVTLSGLDDLEEPPPLEPVTQVVTTSTSGTAAGAL